ncbi:MAG TPA: endonuclease III domain-containing protein [bacterium]|nr:MAG: Ultraviolet N-glycosylase/AP lyase [bacterium ADurb.Bin270]HPW45154.1 endonuclease III domain-containing protein [bacterium]HQC50413.1 endonuclease III domain-containing protein [bacterium]
MASRKTLKEAYDAMLSHFGHLGWWPAQSPFEVMVGAMLTQNTNWKNVERAIENLKNAGMLDVYAIHGCEHAALAELIRPAGYFRLKAGRLKNFIEYFILNYGGDVERMKEISTSTLREELLSVKGIGPETADSILLYALNRPMFVVDAYTKRILLRHSLCCEEDGYVEIQQIFMDNLEWDVPLFNEYHALIVETAKNFCRKIPHCDACPLGNWNR